MRDELRDLSLADSVTIASDVVWRELAGEAVVLSMETGHYFGLNEVGARMWQLIRDHGSLQRVYDELLIEYEVDGHRLERDLLTLASTLCAKRIALRRLESGRVDETP